MRSWDRMRVPRPFGRVSILFGTPIPTEGTDEEVRLRVQNALDALGGEAERALGLSG